MFEKLLNKKPKHRKGAHMHKLKELPRGFLPYRVGDPYPSSLVALAVRTAHGLSTSGPRVPVEHEWLLPDTEHGSIAGYLPVEDNRKPPVMPS